MPPLAELGEEKGKKLRFARVQGPLLDVLLAEQDQQRVRLDEAFVELRDKFRRFEGILPAQQPATFHGELRPYQRDGLGWLQFLDEFRFGGCLADDMGLGKTVQVLAFLESRRLKRADSPRPAARRAAKVRAIDATLVVAPRSLIFNWIEEAKRFAPELRVLNLTGLDRKDAFNQLPEHDLAVTTYGTLRRDIAKLREFQFDYVILDEAQAIKNASSQTAKVCRLLQRPRGGWP